MAFSGIDLDSDGVPDSLSQMVDGAERLTSVRRAAPAVIGMQGLSRRRLTPPAGSWHSTPRLRAARLCVPATPARG